MRPGLNVLNKGVKSEVNLATQWRRISHTFVLNSKGFWVYMHSDQSRKADVFHLDYDNCESNWSAMKSVGVAFLMKYYCIFIIFLHRDCVIGWMFS